MIGAIDQVTPVEVCNVRLVGCEDDLVAAFDDQRRAVVPRGRDEKFLFLCIYIDGPYIRFNLEDVVAELQVDPGEPVNTRAVASKYRLDGDERMPAVGELPAVREPDRIGLVVHIVGDLYRRLRLEVIYIQVRLAL